MSVATKNPFALLEDDSSRPSSPTPAAKAPAADTPAPARPAAQKNAARGGPASRGGRYYPRGGKPGAVKSDDPLHEAPPKNDEKPTDSAEARGRGRGRGGRGGHRGGGRGRGREFDRQSGTGKTESHKQVSQGWGATEGTAELQDEQAATTDATNDWAATGGASVDWAGAGDVAPEDDPWAVPAGTPNDAPAPSAAAGEDRPPRREREREAEEEDNTLTLEQYLAQKKEQEQADLGVPKLEPRKVAAEEWKDATPIKKDEEDAYFAGKPKAAPKQRAKKEEKVYLEFEGRFEPPSRGGRGRGRGGDRGGFEGRARGGRGRGGARGGRGGGGPNGAAAVNVDDETAFPSLA